MKLIICFITFFTSSVVNGYSIFNEPISLPYQEVNKEVTDALIRFNPLTKTNEVIHCPPDTYLDIQTLTCKQTIGLSSRKNEKNNQFYPCPDGPGPTYPNPDSCKSFILCGPAGRTLKKCKEPLLFNTYWSGCDWPNDAHCCEFWEKNTHQILH